MKKILIFYAAYGGGHLSAARSIKEYLEEYNKNDVEVELVNCVEYVNKVVNKITTDAYAQMAKTAPWAWGRVYYRSQKGPLAKISDTSNKMMAIKLKKLLDEKKPDIVISTHPFGSQMCSYLRKKKKFDGKIATIMTDYAPHDQWLVGADNVDYFFVSHNGMKEALVNKGIVKDKVFVTGIPLSNKFLKHYNKEEILEQFGLLKDKKTVLFFGGGEYGLGKTYTAKIFKSLVSRNDLIQIVAISGRNLKMKENFEEIAKELDKEESVKILEYTDKIPELMSISDLVVTKPGGLTTTESLASGLPIVIINPIPGQEEENAEFLENKGVAIWIRKKDNIEEKLNELLSDKSKMENLKIRARISAKRNSTADICKTILKDI